MSRYETARRTYWFATTNYVEDLRADYLAAKAEFEALGGVA